MKRIVNRLALYIEFNFFIGLSVVFCMFIVVYLWPNFKWFANAGLISFLLLCLTDVLWLMIPNKPIRAERNTTEKWSLGDENKTTITLRNRCSFKWFCKIIDELPVELQIRDSYYSIDLLGHSMHKIEYTLVPKSRGLYQFGALRIFIFSPIRFFSRRISFFQKTEVAVYPSFKQVKKFNLASIQKLSHYYGIKKLRRIGSSFEFEQIKEYVAGDDIRHINWTATAKSNGLKTNHFIEEKAQPVYCFIDKSRSMNLGSNGMTLIDFAINTSLVLSNVALQKGDKAGLITFSNKLHQAVRAENSTKQMLRLVDILYNQKSVSAESNYELLYLSMKRIVNVRSLIFLFTNFESLYAMERVKPVLRKIAKQHVLVVVFFENSETEEYANRTANNLEEVYSTAIARQMYLDKRLIAAELNNYGINTMVSKPEELTISSINRYLQIKAKGTI